MEMELSVVTTLYRSSPYLPEFYRRMKAAAEGLVADYEIILVNDGSPDNALEIALALRDVDPRVVVVDLSRNFGHHKAMMTGLSFARGRKVFLIDCDLEEEPELLDLFNQRLLQENCDVVFGVQTERKGGWIERFSGECFYTLINRLSELELPRNVVTARLMSRRYVKSLLEHREQALFLVGVWHITGYKQVPIPVVKHSKGESSYDLRRKLSILVNSITSFSDRPLIFIFYTGAWISFVAASYILFLVVAKIFFGIPVGGWTSLIVSIWFLGGLTIFFIGVIGIYLSRVFVETKQRPYTIVREVYRAGDE